jgi:hypothetical protein
MPSSRTLKNKNGRLWEQENALYLQTFVSLEQRLSYIHCGTDLLHWNDKDKSSLSQRPTGNKGSRGGGKKWALRILSAISSPLCRQLTPSLEPFSLPKHVTWTNNVARGVYMLSEVSSPPYVAHGYGWNSECIHPLTREEMAIEMHLELPFPPTPTFSFTSVSPSFLWPFFRVEGLYKTESNQ